MLIVPRRRKLKEVGRIGPETLKQRLRGIGTLIQYRKVEKRYKLIRIAWEPELVSEMSVETHTRRSHVVKFLGIQTGVKRLGNLNRLLHYKL